jgi:SAM-dependent methyltransferase
MNQAGQWQVVGTSAENYEQYLVPTIFGPWAENLLDLVEPKLGERVLDLACGTGILARLVAQRIGKGGRVVGLDLNQGMLAVARSIAPADPVEWQEASALSLPFEPGSFDVVVCQQGLQFFPDRPLALAEMRRVLRPGGRVGISTWRGIAQAPGFAVLAAAVSEEFGGDTAAPLRGPFGLADESMLRGLLVDAGFRDVSIRSAVRTLEFPSIDAFAIRYLSASPLAGVVAQLHDEAREQLLARVRTGLGSHVTGDGLRFPTESHLTTATA